MFISTILTCGFVFLTVVAVELEVALMTIVSVSASVTREVFYCHCSVQMD